MPLAESDFPELYRLLIDNLETIAVFLIDRDGRIASWNPGVERNLGYSEAEFLGRDVALLFVPEDNARGEPARERETAQRTGRSLDRRWHLRKDGKRLFVDGVLVALRQPGGDVIGYAKIMRDITGQHRAQMLLQESERRLRLATDAAGAGVWSLDPASGRVELSAQCRRLFGLDPLAEVGAMDSILQRIHPDDRGPVEEKMRRAVENSTDYDMEFRVVCTEGAIRHLMAKGIAQTAAGADRPWFTGVVLDITDRKQAEAAERERHRLESIGMLAGGVAHEFNNLLTGIIGNASLIGENLEHNSETAQRVQDLLQSADRAADLTRQLLAYSGKGRFMLEPLDLSVQVREVAGLLGASLPKKIRLRLELAPNLPPVEGDRMQIRQAVLDLVSNSHEAIGGGPGEIVVRTEEVDLTEALIEKELPERGLKPGRYVTITVSDTGTGMDESVRARIFDPFFTTKFLGRGLGLPAVQGVVRGHGGAVTVDSATGRGTTMTLYFPATEQAERKRDVPRRPATSRKRLVLVVDDEDMVRKVAVATLQKRGYSVITAENGEEAVRIFSELSGSIDLVLMDMTMPVMGGEEATAAIRRIRPDVPIIASSGYSQAEALERFGVELAGYIQKPYTAGKLGEAVKAAVEGS